MHFWVTGPWPPQLALALMAVVLLLLAFEHAQRGGGRTYHAAQTLRAGSRFRLSAAHSALAIIACLIPITLGALLPAGILLNLSLSYGHDLTSPRYLRFGANTLFLGISAAALAVACSLVLAYGARLSASRVVRAAVRMAGLGYVLPGSVIAIGILIPLTRLDHAANALSTGLFGQSVGLIATGTLAALIFAYLVRFLMVSLRTVQASLGRITPHMDEAARALGHTPTQTLARVHIPLMRTSLLTAGFIFFVEVVKELPATLILRPFEFDTLAIQAYRLASDERLAEASSAALAIFAVGLVGVLFLTRTIVATGETGAAQAPARGALPAAQG